MTGQVEQFEQCFAENYRRLFHLAYKLTGSFHDAEDVVQDAYLAAWAALPRFKGESSLFTWLYRITGNCAYKYMGRVRKLPVQLLAEKTGQSEAAVISGLPRASEEEEKLLTAEMREACLNGFMKCLPPRQRIAFTLRVVLELSLAETASIMETSVANAKVLVHRARRFMKDLMENRCSYLDEKNPCRCGAWVAFALEKGILKRPETKQGRSFDLWPEFAREVDILRKIELMQSHGRNPGDLSVFMKGMKKIIKEKKLKILS